jgi:hypothetical protein
MTKTGFRFPPEIIQQAKSFAKGAKASDPWRSLGASASCRTRYAAGALAKSLLALESRNIVALWGLWPTN